MMTGYAWRRSMSCRRYTDGRQHRPARRGPAAPLPDRGP